MPSAVFSGQLAVIGLDGLGGNGKEVVTYRSIKGYMMTMFVLM
jgi:hypothetical protein